MRSDEAKTSRRDDLSNTLGAAAEALRRARRVVALTGAGVSAESGLPTFRGRDGWWRRLDPSTLATPEAFAKDPHLVWEWYEHRRQCALATQPNEAHRALATVESSVPSFRLVTQNVDGLHQRAGSTRVVELHGNLTRARCTGDCGVVHLPATPVEVLPPRCACGRLLRPDVIWFGEALPRGALTQAFEAVLACDVLLVVGTSATVYPAADLPRRALSVGGYVVEVNPDATPLSPLAHLALHGPAAAILPEVVRQAFGRQTASPARC
jgi:NAD-dependent deacetylase